MLKITIVIATYNAEKTLKQALDSIRYQTYKNVECIVFDGGSTDRTIEIVKEYDDVVTKWISEKDNGIYDAFNKGINLATGDYICFLGSDDCYCDYEVMKSVASYLSNKTDVLSAPVKLVNEIDGKEKFLTNKYKREDILSGQMIPHQGLFVKLDVMKSYYFNKNNKIISDYEFVFRYIMDGKHIKFIDDCVVYYSNGGLSSVEFGSKNYMRVFYEEILLLHRMDVSDEQMQALFERFLRLENNDSIKYHIKNIRRIITKRIWLVRIVREYFEKLKTYFPSKKKHRCNLRCCRWCGRNFEGVIEK